jgi:hypothetical protein
MEFENKGLTKTEANMFEKLRQKWKELSEEVKNYYKDHSDYININIFFLNSGYYIRWFISELRSIGARIF